MTARPEKIKRPTIWHWTRGLAEACPRCDGCGWYEGGVALQTKCSDCGGTGFVFKAVRQCG